MWKARFKKDMSSYNSNKADILAIGPHTAKQMLPTAGHLLDVTAWCFEQNTTKLVQSCFYHLITLKIIWSMISTFKKQRPFHKPGLLQQPFDLPEAKHQKPKKYWLTPDCTQGSCQAFKQKQEMWLCHSCFSLFTLLSSMFKNGIWRFYWLIFSIISDVLVVYMPVPTLFLKQTFIREPFLILTCVLMSFELFLFVHPIHLSSPTLYWFLSTFDLIKIILLWVWLNGTSQPMIGRELVNQTFINHSELGFYLAE